MSGSRLLAPRSLLVVALVFSAATSPAHARLGDTLAKLKEHFGKPPPQDSKKDSVYWLFEGEDGQLVYTVTFNAKGLSIAEGLKPLKFARLTRDTAENFINGQ